MSAQRNEKINVAFTSLISQLFEFHFTDSVNFTRAHSVCLFDKNLI